MPTVILEGKVILQGQVNGSFIDLSVDSTSLAASFKMSRQDVFICFILIAAVALIVIGLPYLLAVIAVFGMQAASIS